MTIEDIYIMALNSKDIFRIRPINEERTEFIITVGDHLATEKHFTDENEAWEYVKEPKWDTVVAVMGEMNNMLEKKLTEK